jgi:hypothetical protein
MRSAATLCPMTEERIDPAGNTEQWRAFAHGSDPVVPKRGARSFAPVLIGILVGVLILGALAWLAFG